MGGGQCFRGWTAPLAPIYRHTPCAPYHRARAAWRRGTHPPAVTDYKLSSFGRVFQQGLPRPPLQNPLAGCWDPFRIKP